MGWNDHVEFLKTECLDCGEVDDWEYWSEIGRARYGGGLDKKLGVDVGKHAKCPHCGSTNGRVCPDEPDEPDEPEWD